MKNQIEKVGSFHKTFLQEDKDKPTLVKENIFELRHRLMEEENNEYLEACQKEDIVGVADALGDQLYILCGTILKHGLQHKIEEVFDEIHASNLSKLDADGNPIFREDGKIMKSNRYFKPDIKKILDK